jgi:hypothetical protein
MIRRLSDSRQLNGGKGIRTPDFQLAKLALYQLSYAPRGIADCRLKIADCNGLTLRSSYFQSLQNCAI